MAAPSEDAIFDVARQIHSQAARDAYLNQVCDGNKELRARLVELLTAHDAPDSYLDNPPLTPTAVRASGRMLENEGDLIGPYKLRERLGEGGMGVVWAAEQKQPLRRKVAIKVIKPGMDSSQVIARFEAEREALSLMDHPNIARVLDAGATEQGRPYFVMELIHGVPITEYCDAQKLTILDRIQLFILVCKAVQHAHLKGIIHRDIKPSNVLVTEQDGEPVPKVIDFGVAKALHRSLTDRSIYTGVFQAIGTLAYMSPEQATLSQHDVDTRADVYSLGILLYELLTGTTPLDRNELEKGALDEALRMIREREPLKPSTKISSLGDDTELVSQLRCADARSLTRSVRGDLDWIVMKALEKDRKRRYENTSQLSDELVRFLQNRPVEACPPSMAYRARKFAQRNRGLVVAVVGVAVLLTGGIVGIGTSTLWALREAEQKIAYAQEVIARENELTKRSLELTESLKREAATAALAGDIDGARATLDLLKKLSKSEYEYERNVIEGLIALNNGDYERARDLAVLAQSEELRRKESDQIAALSLHALALWYLGDSESYGQKCRVIATLTPETDTDHLLMALALMLIEPRRAAGLLENTTAGSNSAIGLLIRGIVHNFIGCDDQDTNMIDNAIRDIDCSRLLMRKETIGYGWQLHAISTGFEIARYNRREGDTARYLHAGRALVEQAAPDNSATHIGRWQFYRADGEMEKAAQAIQEVGRFSTYGVLLLAVDCLQRLNDPNALAEFDGAINDDLRQTDPVQMARLYLMPEFDADAEAFVARMLKKDSSFEGLYALCALCRTAPVDQVRQRAIAFAARKEVAGSDNESFRNMPSIQVLADGDEEKCLNEAGDGALAKSQAYFTIGMLRLAKRDRSGAYEQFKCSVETNAVATYGYELARAFKERMDRDPGWPRWTARTNPTGAAD